MTEGLKYKFILQLKNFKYIWIILFSGIFLKSLNIVDSASYFGGAAFFVPVMILGFDIFEEVRGSGRFLRSLYIESRRYSSYIVRQWLIVSLSCFGVLLVSEVLSSLIRSMEFGLEDLLLLAGYFSSALIVLFIERVLISRFSVWLTAFGTLSSTLILFLLYRLISGSDFEGWQVVLYTSITVLLSVLGYFSAIRITYKNHNKNKEKNVDKLTYRVI